MATQNIYSFQTGGIVKIGATVWDNVTSVETSYSQEPPRTDYVSAGDTVAEVVEGILPKGEFRLTVNMYDETGISGTLDSFQVGNANSIDQDIVIQPQGAGTGKKQLTLADMRLIEKSQSFPTGAEKPITTGSLVWRGFFDEEPAFTAQA